MQPRWEGDDRGRGIADAGHLVAGAGELVEAFSAADWVAEDPERHLLPHIDEWCRRDGRFALTDARGDGHGAYVLELEWRGAQRGRGQVRAAVFALIGQFAESATYVRQRVVGNGDGSRLQFEIGTGELGSDARFAPHGHALLINITGDV
jgi:hypothetical protein